VIGKTRRVPPISRRLFLAGSAAVVVTACSGDDEASPPSTTEPVPAPPTSAAPATTAGEATTTTDAPTTTTTTTPPGPALERDPFTLGVASGDPAPGTVVLWTRLAPEPLTGGRMPADDVEVRWEVAASETFDDVEASGTAVATAAHAHSVHAVAMVGPGERWYRFHAGGWTSPVGRTSAAPGPGVPVERVRVASASCQHYEDGWYVAHRDLAAQRPDLVVFLGDYIYEGGAGEVGVDGNVRTHGTPEVRTLEEYRDRYARYKSDPDLQAAHAACPWFVTWDDHEVENNYAGTVPQDPADAPGFADRRAAAYHAWWEHQPVALPPPDGSGTYRIHRAGTWGDLLTLAMLDGRQYRSDQTCGDVGLDLDPACPETFDPARTMLGDEQEAWLLDLLSTGTATWHAIGQQTVFGDTTLGPAVLNHDQWDGYPVQRGRIVERIAAAQAAGHALDLVVLTGDIHFAGAGMLRHGPRGTGTPIGVELVATSISSGGRIDPAVQEVVKAIPDILDVELEHRGYILHTVTPERWSAEYRMAETVKEPDGAMYVHATYEIDAGTRTVRFAGT